MFNPDDVFEEGKIYMTPEEGQNEESSHGMGKYVQDRGVWDLEEHFCKG